MASQRRATISRKTAETAIEVAIDLDGKEAQISTGVDFFDHMLHAFAKHASVGVRVRAKGDGMDHHHLIEDVGIALGTAIHEALGDKRGIARYGSVMVPLDDALVAASVDLSGRAYANVRISFLRENLGEMPTEMVGEFFRALSDNAKITLHLVQMNGHVAHHLCEAAFKAFARAFAAAKTIVGDEIPSTKGVLE